MGTGPYPDYGTIRDGHVGHFDFNHTDLRDLEYIVGRAIFQARNTLVTRKHEVDK